MIILEKEDRGNLTLNQFIIQYEVGVKTGDYTKKEFAEFYGFKINEINSTIKYINENNEKNASTMIKYVNDRWIQLNQQR